MTTHKDKKTGKRVLQPVADPQAQDIAKAAAEREARKAALEAATATESETATHVAGQAETPASEAPVAPQSTSEGEVTLDAALAKVSAEYVAPSAEQIAGMLASDAALKAAVEAFQALSMDAREKFSQITGLRSRKTAEKKAKVEVDPALQRKVRVALRITVPSAEDYAAFAAAEAGIMPVAPKEEDFLGKKATIYHQVWKSKSTKTLFAAVNAHDLAALEDELLFIDSKPTLHTAGHVIRTYGKLAEIAIKAQNTTRGQ